MLEIPAASLPARAARLLCIVRCWKVQAIRSTNSEVWRLTDSQTDIRIQEHDGTWATYSPAQIVFAQSRRRQTGMRANSSELRISMDGSTGINSTHLDRDLLAGARVTEYEVDGLRPWITHKSFRWYVGDVQNGGSFAVLSLVGISSRFQETTGEQISTGCQNKFADSRCDAAGLISGNPDFVFRSYEIGAHPNGMTLRRLRIREGVDQFPTDALAVADWWAHGQIRFSDGANAGMTAVVESNEQPVWWAAGPWYYVDLILATPITFVPAEDDVVQMRVGCPRIHAVCKSKFSNLDQFRGDRDISGSDTLQRTPGAE